VLLRRNSEISRGVYAPLNPSGLRGVQRSCHPPPLYPPLMGKGHSLLFPGEKKGDQNGKN